jgi:hypothetical protein
LGLGIGVLPPEHLLYSYCIIYAQINSGSPITKVAAHNFMYGIGLAHIEAILTLAPRVCLRISSG